MHCHAELCSGISHRRLFATSSQMPWDLGTYSPAPSAEHEPTPILCWHKQHRKRIKNFVHYKPKLILGSGMNRTFYTVCLICINSFKRFHTSHHLKLNESEAVNFYFLKLSMCSKKISTEKHHCKHHYSNCTSWRFLDAIRSDSRWNKMPCLSCLLQGASFLQSLQSLAGTSAAELALAETTQTQIDKFTYFHSCENK